MAVNETIVTNRYFRRCTDAANKVWQRISFWHKASDCEFDDGSTAQTKVGAIKGITTSTSVTETGYAADMTTVKGLQTQIDELNSNLGNLVYKINVQLSSITTREPAGEWSSNIRYGYKTDISKVYPFYKRLSSDNFIIELLGGSGSSSVGNGGAQNAGNSTLTKSYDADTGILTIDGTGHYHSYDGSSGSYNTAICVYLVLSNVKELP